MTVCFIHPKSPDIVSRLSQSEDSTEFEGHFNVPAVIQKIELANAHYSRIIVVNNSQLDPSSLYDLAKLAEKENSELIVACEESHYDNLKGILTTSNSLIITTPNGTSPKMSWLRKWGVTPFNNLVQEYGRVEEVPVASATVYDTGQNLPQEQNTNLNYLNLADEGETHSDTGWLDGDVEAMIQSEDTKLRESWGSIPDEYPGYNKESANPYPALKFDTRVVVVTGTNPSLVSSAAVVQAGSFRDDNNYSILYADLQRGEGHQIASLFEDPNEVEVVSPSISEEVLYDHGPITFATNGLNSDHTPADLKYLVDTIMPKYSHIVVDIMLEDIKEIGYIIKNFPDTPIVWAFQGDEAGYQEVMSHLLNSSSIPSKFIKPFAKRLFLHPGHPDQSFYQALQLNEAFVWDRVDFYNHFDALKVG